MHRIHLIVVSRSKHLQVKRFSIKYSKKNFVDFQLRLSTIGYIAGLLCRVTGEVWLQLWTLNKELCENVEAFEMQRYRRAMRISYVQHVTNEVVLRRVGQDRGLLGQVKSRKLKYFGHTTRHESLEKDIMPGIMPGKRRQGGQNKQWINGIVQWGERSLVEMVRQAEQERLPVLSSWSGLRSYIRADDVAIIPTDSDCLTESTLTS